MHTDQAQRIHQLFTAAAQRHRSGQLGEAARLYREILALDANHADALNLLGVVALQTGRGEEAIELIGRAIVINGQVASFHNNLGNARRALGQLQPAALAFARALSLNEQAPDVRYNLAVVLQELGRLDEARAAYQQVLAARPDHAAAYGNLGNVHSAQGRFEEALTSYEQALRCQPAFVPALINRGNVLRSLGRLEEAHASYRRALALDPRAAEAHNNLGLALLEAARPDEAVQAYERALSFRPGYVEALRNLGHALRELGRDAEAAAAYRQALTLDPDDAEARLALCMLSIPVFAGDIAQSQDTAAAFERALSELAQWNGARPGRLGRATGSSQPFYLAYRPAPLATALTRYGDLVCPAAADYWAQRPGASEAVLCTRTRTRVVLVCGHVRSQHPVWEMLLRGVLAHLTRDRLEIILYHTGSNVDAETHWARSRVDRFVQGPRSTAAWIAETRADRPDIMFYPEVGMDPATCALAALRLAPLQMASWGHPVTTGLSTIDVYVSGELLESEQAAAHYRERLVLLPGTGVCTQAPIEGATPWNQPRPADDVVRFALPHQPIKFDPGDDRLLARICRAVGRCEFWFAYPSKLGWATDRLLARLAEVFRREGLNPQEHLRVTPWLPRDQFLGFLDAMDVYLDCPAFSGYTTAWQAVHRGLPLVTLEGSFLRQRLAAGLLRQINEVDGIAQSPDQYVELAVQFAEASREALRQVATRQRIRQSAVRANDNLAAVLVLERLLSGNFSDAAG